VSGGLFDGPRRTYQHARVADPETSKAAGKKWQAVGGAAAETALRLLVQSPGRTGAELNELAGRDPSSRTLPRRLADLAADGFVYRGTPRACHVTHETATTWWPLPKGIAWIDAHPEGGGREA